MKPYIARSPRRLRWEPLVAIVALAAFWGLLLWLIRGWL